MQSQDEKSLLTSIRTIYSVIFNFDVHSAVLLINVYADIKIIIRKRAMRIDIYVKSVHASLMCHSENNVVQIVFTMLI